MFHASAEQALEYLVWSDPPRPSMRALQWRYAGYGSAWAAAATFLAAVSADAPEKYVWTALTSAALAVSVKCARNRRQWEKPSSDHGTTYFLNGGFTRTPPDLSRQDALPVLPVDEKIPDEPKNALVLLNGARVEEYFTVYDGVDTLFVAPIIHPAAQLFANHTVKGAFPDIKHPYTPGEYIWILASPRPDGLTVLAHGRAVNHHMYKHGNHRNREFKPRWLQHS